MDGCFLCILSVSKKESGPSGPAASVCLLHVSAHGPNDLTVAKNEWTHCGLVQGHATLEV